MRRGAILGLLAVLPFAAEASPHANLKCAFKSPVVELTSLADLPPPVAEHIVSNEKVPFRRLLRAGRQNDLWFVWLAVKGAPRRIEVFDFYRGRAKMLNHHDIVADKDPCEMTASMLENQTTVERLLDNLPSQPDPPPHP